jgi:hypothetical protein
VREQFHTEWERAVKNKMMWIAVFIGCLLAIAQTVFEVYPYARNPLMFYRGSDGQPASLFMYWFGLNSGSPYKVAFLTIFPVLAMMPHALSYHLDRKGGYIKNVYTRTKKINYLTAKYLAVFLSGGLTVLFPYLVSLPVTACMLPALTPIRNGQYLSATELFSSIFYTKPFAYIAIYMVITFFYGGIFATTALAAASIVDNIFLLGMVPFLIWYGFTTASNFVGRKSGITVDLIWLLDMSHGAILHKETVFVTGAVVGVITAIIYFVNGVKQDAL